MVQVRADHVVVMIAVRDARMSAGGAVLVTSRVPCTTVRRRALRRIASPYRHSMLVDVVTMNVVQVAVV
jgi:hypothetical protein